MRRIEMKPWKTIRSVIKNGNDQESVFKFMSAFVRGIPSSMLDNVSGKIPLMMGQKNLIRRVRYSNISNWWSESCNFCRELHVDKAFAYSHILLPSKDEGYVTYFSSVNKLLKDNQDGEGIRTKTTLGRFLKKFSTLTDNEIKAFSENYSSKFQKRCLFFIPNTNPDGWEDVYEHGWGYNSCMVYNKTGNTYLDDRCHGEYHPARAYAYPDNDLALVYMANREWSADNEGFNVYSRAIVNIKNKTYLKIYGDDSMSHLLEHVGYVKDDATTDGQKLVRLMLSDEEIVCPCLDGYQDEVEDFGDYLGIVRNGMDTSSSGVINIKWICPYCGHQHLNEKDIFEVSDGDELRCTECVNDSHVWGYSSYEEGWIKADSAILISGEYYIEEAAERFNYHYSDTSGEWIHKSNGAFTSRGIMYLSDSNLTVLALPCPNGHYYAHICDTVSAWNSKGVEHIVHKDMDLSNRNLFDTNTFNQESENRKAS